MTTARIDIEYASNTNIDIVKVTVPNATDTDFKGCNVSNPDDIKTASYFKGYKGFHLSGDTGITSALDSSCRYYSDHGYPGYCSRILSDDNCVIDDTLWLTVKHTQIKPPKDLTIHFDKVAGVFAQDMQISTYSNKATINIVGNEDYKCYVNIESLNLDREDTIIIRFTKLNKPNVNLCVTKIVFSFTKSYNDNIIKQFKNSEQLMDTIFNINPTVLEQYAEITFKDKYGEFKQFAKEGLLSDNSEIDIYINDDLVGTYLSESWNLRGGDSTVKLNCNDPSKSFDYSYVKELVVKDRTLHELLELGFDIDKSNWKYIDDDTAQYCKNFVAHNSWVYESTLREYFKKVCLIGLLRIYWYKDTFIIARCY